jgi:hypothetical protein
MKAKKRRFTQAQAVSQDRLTAIYILWVESTSQGGLKSPPLNCCAIPA